MPTPSSAAASSTSVASCSVTSAAGRRASRPLPRPAYLLSRGIDRPPEGLSSARFVAAKRSAGTPLRVLGVAPLAPVLAQVVFYSLGQLDAVGVAPARCQHVDAGDQVFGSVHCTRRARLRTGTAFESLAGWGGLLVGVRAWPAIIARRAGPEPAAPPPSAGHRSSGCTSCAA